MRIDENNLGDVGLIQASGTAPAQVDLIAGAVIDSGPSSGERWEVIFATSLLNTSSGAALNPQVQFWLVPIGTKIPTTVTEFVAFNHTPIPTGDFPNAMTTTGGQNKTTAHTLQRLVIPGGFTIAVVYFSSAANSGQSSVVLTVVRRSVKACL